MIIILKQISVDAGVQRVLWLYQVQQMIVFWIPRSWRSVQLGLRTRPSLQVCIELVRLPMWEHCCSCKILLQLQSLKIKYCRSRSRSRIKAAANKPELGDQDHPHPSWLSWHMTVWDEHGSSQGATPLQHACNAMNATGDLGLLTTHTHPCCSVLSPGPSWSADPMTHHPSSTDTLLVLYCTTTVDVSCKRMECFHKRRHAGSD
jgi:hypothetical protein